MIEMLSILLPIGLILSVPTYFWLRERARRKQAEGRLIAAGLAAPPPQKPQPFTPWSISASPVPLPTPASAPLDEIPAPPPHAVRTPVAVQAVTGAPKRWQPDMNPPAGLAPIRAVLDRVAPDDPYAFGVLWVKPEGDTRPGRYMFHASLADGEQKVNFLLVTGEPEHGKDSLIASMLLPMLQRAQPHQLQLMFFDGTRADGALTRGIAHNFVTPLLAPEDIRAGLRVWRLERERRERLLDQHGVTKWESLPAHMRPPLLLIVVSEVEVIARGMAGGDKIEDWLSVELAAMRKCGMRAWLCTQNVSGMGTSWRDKCRMKLAGYQPADRLVQPNTSLTSEEIRRAGALAPTELYEPGLFTMIDKATVLTGRAGYTTDEERAAAYRALPQALAPDIREQRSVLEGALLVEAPVLTEVPAGMIFSEMSADDQYALIRNWHARGLTRNDMVQCMRPIARGVALEIIRKAIGNEQESAHEARVVHDMSA